MRNAVLLLSLLLVLSGGSAGAAPAQVLTVGFAGPAGLGGDLVVENGTWLSMDGLALEAWGLELDLGPPGGDVEGTNATRLVLRVSADPLAAGNFPLRPTESALGLDGIRTIRLESRPQEEFSLYLHAERVEVSARQPLAELDVLEDESPQAFHPGPPSSENRRPYAPRETGVAAVLSPPATADGGLLVVAHGIDRIAWFNLASACLPAEAACPSGSGAHAIGPGGAPAQVWGYSVHSLSSASRQVSAVARLGSIEGTLAMGGPAPSVHVDGWARLPRATWSAPCPACEPAPNGTLALEGNLSLEGLSPREGGRMEASLGGSVTGARLDEAALDPKAFALGASIVAGVGIGALLVAKLALAILARPAAKDHPRRLLLARLVQRRPGITFRGILRESGLASGVAQHHLSLLVRRGALVAQPHDGKTLYFENHGKHAGTWRQTVAEGDENERRVLDAVRAAPGVRQLELAQQLAKRHAWDRSIAKYRIRKLEEAGLLRAVRKGRAVRYWATEG